MFRKMYNNQNPEHNNNNKATGHPPPTMTSPRISFSNDFVESSQYSHSNSNFNSNSNSNFNSHHHQIRAAAAAYRDAPVSSDFEFSVTNYSMMSADELFFKGRLLPLKESCTSNGAYNGGKTTTLRDELEHNEEEEEEDGGGGGSGNGASFSLRPPKNPTRWRGFLGLRKSHIGSKKSDKSAADKRNTTSYNQHDDVQCNNNNNSQGFVD
ncbi:hypothetical protein ABFS83_08G048900 [Erythranthe nasuta]